MKKNATIAARKIAVPVAFSGVKSHVWVDRRPRRGLDLPGEPGDRELEHRPRERSALGEQLLERRDAPHQDERGEDVERAPRDRDLAHRVLVHRRRLAAAFAEGVPGLPEARQHHDRRHRGEPRAEIGELGTEEPQRAALHRAERHAHDEGREPRLAQPPPAVDDHDEQERHEEGERLQQQHEHPRQILDVDTADLRADDHRNADRSVGAGRHVGHQADHGGLDRTESELHQERGADRDRHAEPRGPLEEGAEREGDEEHLDALIRRDAADRAADDFEVPARHGEPVQPHGHDDDVGDGPERVEQSVEPGAGGCGSRHPEHPQRHDDLGDDRDERRDDAGQLEDDQTQQEEQDRHRGDERGEPEDAERVRGLNPHGRVHSTRNGGCTPPALNLANTKCRPPEAWLSRC